MQKYFLSLLNQMNIESKVGDKRTLRHIVWKKDMKQLQIVLCLGSSRDPLKTPQNEHNVTTPNSHLTSQPNFILSVT